jgi:hypothetical protein
MILTRMGVIASSISGSGGTPPGPYTDGTYYYVVVNRQSKLYKWISNPRTRIDVDAFDIYQKPDGTNQSEWKPTLLNLYTYLSSSLGDQTILTSLSVPYTSGQRRWLTTVNVTVSNGYPSFSFPDGGTGSRGANFYTSSVLPHIP